MRARKVLVSVLQTFSRYYSEYLGGIGYSSLKMCDFRKQDLPWCRRTDHRETHSIFRPGFADRYDEYCFMQTEFAFMLHHQQHTSYRTVFIIILKDDVRIQSRMDRRFIY